jgi:hypothetical protein
MLNVMVVVNSLKVADMLAAKKLPSQLKLLLSHPRILKAGRLVNADLKYLEVASQSSIPFIGGLDLAKYAKDRQMVSNAKCSLADLCAIVLRKRLNKNVSERLSNQWENEDLSPEQLEYAARDAYASLQIYCQLSVLNAPQPLPQVGDLHPFTPVLIYNSENTTLIARGQLSPNLHIPQHDGINISPSRTLVEVTEVLVPAAIVTTHRKKALNLFGPSPFTIVCLRSHLRSYTPLPASGIINTRRNSFNSHASPSQLIANPKPPSQANSELELNEDSLSQSEPGESIATLIFGACDQPGVNTKDQTQIREADETSRALGDQTLGSNPVVWDTKIHSRILKDPFHVFNMFYISRRHGLRKEFARELRNAIFIDDKDDQARINAWGAIQNPKCSFVEFRRRSPTWVQKRCKRVIPPPEILYPLVANVFRTYGPLKDSATGAPLFTPDNWCTAKNILDLIYHGYLSDPPGIPLYTVIGLDSKSGLPIYCCSRGTNYTEGGVHTHLRSHLPTSGASIRHLHARLLDFVLRHNLLVFFYYFALFN